MVQPFFPPSCSHGPDLRSCLQISCKEAKIYEGFFGKEAKVLIHVMKMPVGPGPPRLPSRVGLHFSPLKCHITACPSRLLWDLQSHCSCGAALVAVGLNCSCIHSDPPNCCSSRSCLTQTSSILSSVFNVSIYLCLFWAQSLNSSVISIIIQFPLLGLLFFFLCECPCHCCLFYFICSWRGLVKLNVRGTFATVLFFFFYHCHVSNTFNNNEVDDNGSTNNSYVYRVLTVCQALSIISHACTRWSPIMAPHNHTAQLSNHCVVLSLI